MISKLRSKVFYNSEFWQKKESLERFIAVYSDVKVGGSLVCFEDKQKIPKGWTNKFKPKKLISFTVGKVYKIVDKRRGKIKIEGDTGAMIWTTTERFLGDKALRAAKLKELNKGKCITNILTE